MHFKKFLSIQEMAAKRSVNRLVNITQDPDRLVAIISASREGREVEPHATNKLKQIILSQGYSLDGKYGVTPTWGVYKEPGQPAAKEKSLFVSWPKDKPAPPHEEIIKFFVGLAEQFQQIGVIIKLPGDDTAYEYFTSHAPTPGKRIPYNEPRKESEPMYSTRPRFRGYGKNDTASRTDALTYTPDFDAMQQTA